MSDLYLLFACHNNHPYNSESIHFPLKLEKSMKQMICSMLSVALLAGCTTMSSDKTREEERQYKRSIGLRTTRSLFSFAPRTGKTEEQNSRLKAFVAEKEALKLRIHSVRSSP